MPTAGEFTGIKLIAAKEHMGERWRDEISQIHGFMD
jgi:hypothetical protein